MNWQQKWAEEDRLRARLSDMSYDELCDATTRRLKREFNLSGHTIGAMVRNELRGRP